MSETRQAALIRTAQSASPDPVAALTLIASDPVVEERDKLAGELTAARAAIREAAMILQREFDKFVGCQWCASYSRATLKHHADCRFGNWLARPAVVAAVKEGKG